MRLKNRKIIIGVTGGIGAYKALELVRCLKAEGAWVKVIMTKNAKEFVSPLSFETLSENPISCELFEERGADLKSLEHIDLAKKVDLLCVAPATANIIGKVASGIADDLLTTVIMATKAPVLFAPAMNDVMWENRIVKDNVKRLTDFGYRFIGPDIGPLACGTVGIGRLAPISEILEAIVNTLVLKTPLTGKRILVTCGRTEEPLDPIRVLTNRSSGRMGIEIANAAQKQGADVSLICGRTSFPLPEGIKIEMATTAQEMRKKVLQELSNTDILFMAAAVSDYQPGAVRKSKIKDESITLNLVHTPDILTEVRKKAPKTFLVGFSLETEDEIRRAREKLKTKGLDLIVVNPVTSLEGEMTKPTLVFKDGRMKELDSMTKKEFALVLLNEVLERLANKNVRRKKTATSP